MTIGWTIKEVNEWLENCTKYRGLDECWEEATDRFGIWTYSLSYGSCFELRDRVEEYLRKRGIAESMIIKCTDIFWGIPEAEIKYDEEVYDLLIEALDYISKTNEHFRYRASALAELIRNAKKLKSNIICSG